MGVIYEDECVGCPTHMGCLGSACPYKNVPHYYCDVCGEVFDPDELHKVDNDMVCEECLFEMFPKISV